MTLPDSAMFKAILRMGFLEKAWKLWRITMSCSHRQLFYFVSQLHRLVSAWVVPGNYWWGKGGFLEIQAPCFWTSLKTAIEPLQNDL